jgi:hypothetical protein
MTHTLRAALAAKAYKVTVSESLELMAQAFGAADWNAVSDDPRAGGRSPQHCRSDSDSDRRKRPRIFRRAFIDVVAGPGLRQRKHQYATLEHSP